MTLPSVEGLVFGNWGAASQGTHQLVEALACSRAQVCEPQARGRNGNTLTEDGIKAMAVGHIRRKLRITALKTSAISLAG